MQQGTRRDRARGRWSGCLWSRRGRASLRARAWLDAVAGHRHDVTVALRRRGNRAFLLLVARPRTRRPPRAPAASPPRSPGRPRASAGPAAGAAPGTPAARPPPPARRLSPEITLGPRLGGRKCAWTRRPADPPGQDDQGLRDQDVRQQRHGTRSPRRLRQASPGQDRASRSTRQSRAAATGAVALHHRRRHQGQHWLAR